MRDIVPKLFDWFDEQLKPNGLAQEAIRTKDARTLFICAMQVTVGIREKGGNNKGPLVELLQDTVGGVSAEAWCMSLIQSGIAYVEKKLDVKSPVAITEHCLTCWEKTPKEQRVKIFPLPGAICIWQHGRSSAGHTGMVLTADNTSKTMTLVEGNTESGNEKGEVVREGGGVYFTRRNMKATGSMRVVGFLRPFSAGRSVFSQRVVLKLPTPIQHAFWDAVYSRSLFSFLRLHGAGRSCLVRGERPRLCADQGRAAGSFHCFHNE